MLVEDDLQEIIIDSFSAPKVSLTEEEIEDDSNLLTKYLLEGKNFIIVYTDTLLPAPTVRRFR